MFMFASLFKINKKDFAFGLAIAISILISFIALIVASVNASEHFTPMGMDYPKLGDAMKNAWYTTFGKECKPGLKKCKVWNGHNYQYFCSDNCRIPEQNLRGKPMNNLSWFERYV